VSLSSFSNRLAVAGKSGVCKFCGGVGMRRHIGVMP
jgi:hypothetical protein